MGGYIGHCEDCDIVMEGENMVEFLLQKYDKKKVTEILKYAVYESENEANV